jgi:hypothetical protein
VQKNRTEYARDEEEAKVAAPDAGPAEAPGQDVIEPALGPRPPQGRSDRTPSPASSYHRSAAAADRSVGAHGTQDQEQVSQEEETEAVARQVGAAATVEAGVVRATSPMSSSPLLLQQRADLELNNPSSPSHATAVSDRGIPPLMEAHEIQVSGDFARADQFRLSGLEVNVTDLNRQHLLFAQQLRHLQETGDDGDLLL